MIPIDMSNPARIEDRTLLWVFESGSVFFLNAFVQFFVAI